MADQCTGYSLPHLNLSNKAQVIVLCLSYVFMIAMNAISSASTLLNNTDNAIISNANPTYVTPDGSTFSIWGFIYLFETMFVVYQALPSNHDDEKLQAARPLITLIFLINCLWLVVFAYYLWWVSALVMVKKYQSQNKLHIFSFDQWVFISLLLYPACIFSWTCSALSGLECQLWSTRQRLHLVSNCLLYRFFNEFSLDLRGFRCKRDLALKNRGLANR